MKRAWVRMAGGRAAIVFARLCGALPLAASRRLGRFLGAAAYTLWPGLRRRALTHLDLAYGDALTQADKRRIAKGVIQNAAVAAAELPHVPRIDRAFVERHVRLSGVDDVDWSGGVVLVGAHFSNWEWMSPILSALGKEMVEIVRPLDDPQLDAFVDGLRTANGVRTVPKRQGGAVALRALRNGAVAGILADQQPRDNAVPVTFLGHRCWATVAPALLAMRARKPLHVISMPREDDGAYHMRISPPLELEDTGDFRRDLAVNTQRCQTALEAVIRERPEQWLWLHRRWKQRDRLEREWRRRPEEAGEPPAAQS
jgi:KDO2-lipid IV(A) lauroyltransferase